ncbi:hypothetical protein Tco_0772594 [Tanacetum coccineum]|uniref:Uncharacterized protein n=1 Tax=Tanacetum coccineum TaxID=301880 RepID=A0ABQ4ZM64_9ASTR
MSILLHPDRGQYNIRLSPGPLCLPSVQLGRGPSVMVRPRPKSLPYPLCVIKSSQSSIVTVYSVVLRAVNIARLCSFSTARLPSSVTVNFSANNDHFFWVDAFAFPFVVLWHNNKTLRKDPHPTPDEFDVNACDYLADNRAPFRKLLEPFLCFVGISRYYDLDENYYPTFWANDDEEMHLFAFINHADPTKENANVQGAGNNNVNEEGGDVALVDQTEQSDHVVQIGGIDIAADDEA